MPRQLAELLQLSVEEVCGLRRHAAPRLEAPWHLRRGGARILRVAQRPDARAELAGQPGGQLRSGAEGAPHRVLLGLRRALLHVEGCEAGAAERQKTLAAQDGKCALCGCGLTGTCEPVRQAFAGERANFAGAVRRLPQREDAARERAAHEFGEPRGARSPKLPPPVFEAQACAKDALCVGVDVVRCRRNGLANAPFPLPILRPADGVEPVDGVLPDLGFVEGCCDARQSCLNLLPYVGPGLVPEGFAGRDAGAGRLPLRPHRVGHSPPRSTSVVWGAPPPCAAPAAQQRLRLFYAVDGRAVRVAQRLQRPQPLRKALWQPLCQQAFRLHLREVRGGASRMRQALATMQCSKPSAASWMGR